MHLDIIRANYGRFSIAICNEHGKTEWSVNCMSPRTLRVIKARCVKARCRGRSKARKKARCRDCKAGGKEGSKGLGQQGKKSGEKSG